MTIWANVECGPAADSDCVQGNPQWDCGVSNTPTLPYTFSGQPADRQGQRCMQLLSDVLTLDWDGIELDGAATTPVVPPRARRVYSLAHISLGR